jgi:hypothetical protein
MKARKGELQVIQAENVQNPSCRRLNIESHVLKQMTVVSVAE